MGLCHVVQPVTRMAVLGAALILEPYATLNASVQVCADTPDQVRNTVFVLRMSLPATAAPRIVMGPLLETEGLPCSHIVIKDGPPVNSRNFHHLSDLSARQKVVIKARTSSEPICVLQVGNDGQLERTSVLRIKQEAWEQYKAMAPDDTRQPEEIAEPGLDQKLVGLTLPPASIVRPGIAYSCDDNLDIYVLWNVDVTRTLTHEITHGALWAAGQQFQHGVQEVELEISLAEAEAAHNSGLADMADGNWSHRRGSHDSQNFPCGPLFTPASNKRRARRENDFAALAC